MGLSLSSIGSAIGGFFGGPVGATIGGTVGTALDSKGNPVQYTQAAPYNPGAAPGWLAAVRDDAEREIVRIAWAGRGWDQARADVVGGWGLTADDLNNNGVRTMSSGPIIPDYGPISLPGGAQVTQVGFPAVLGGAASVGGRILGLGGGVVAAGVGVIRSVGGRILGVMLPSGQRVGRKAVVALAKQMGVTAAATALGIGAVELAEMVMSEQRGKGRRKGISAANLRTTKRTMRQVMGMHRQITQACGTAGFKKRKC